VTDTPPSGDDDLLGAAAPAPAARQHRSHSSRHRKRGLRPIDIAGIVVAVIVVIGVVIVIAKGHKSASSTAASTTVTTVANGGGSTTTATGGGSVWTFTSLDGKTVKVTKGTTGSSRFVTVSGKSEPAAVAAIDKALAKKDCAAAEKIYNADKTPSPNPKATASNARRSAYANYALVQATSKGCAWAKAIATTTTSA
jgi:hypothetical protein